MLSITDATMAVATSKLPPGGFAQGQCGKVLKRLVLPATGKARRKMCMTIG